MSVFVLRSQHAKRFIAADGVPCEVAACFAGKCNIGCAETYAFKKARTFATLEEARGVAELTSVDVEIVRVTWGVKCRVGHPYLLHPSHYPVGTWTRERVNAHRFRDAAAAREWIAAHDSWIGGWQARAVRFLKVVRRG